MSTELPQVVSHWINVNGLRMHARLAAGPAPIDPLPIILVHGLTVSSRYMVPVARRLARYHRVFAPDLPGFGKSARPAHVLTIAELADALAAWMRACALPAAVFMGQSMGCQVIADLALRYPELVVAAVLIGPSMDRRGRTVCGQWWRLSVDGTRTPPSSLLITLRDFLDCGAVWTLKTLHYALYDRIELKLPRLAAPTLILRGERDPIASQAWVEELVRLLPNGQLQLIAGASHAAHYAAPEETTGRLLAFVRAVRQARWPS
jgi:pimeloyl-ACP methyl ester carboxylesterase